MYFAHANLYNNYLVPSYIKYEFRILFSSTKMAANLSFGLVVLLVVAQFPLVLRYNSPYYYYLWMCTEQTECVSGLDSSFCVLYHSSGFGRVGGLSEERKCEKDCQDIANAVQKDVERELAKFHINSASYEALSYCTQVVAGVNYFIKVCSHMKFTRVFV